MDLTGFKQFSKAEISAWGSMTKERLAKEAIPDDGTFDYALPQQWLDDFVRYAGLRPEYHFVLGTTFMLYSDKRGFRYGMPWSACVEVQNLIEMYGRYGEWTKSNKG